MPAFSANLRVVENKLPHISRCIRKSEFISSTEFQKELRSRRIAHVCFRCWFEAAIGIFQPGFCRELRLIPLHVEEILNLHAIFKMRAEIIQHSIKKRIALSV